MRRWCAVSTAASFFFARGASFARAGAAGWCSSSSSTSTSTSTSTSSRRAFRATFSSVAVPPPPPLRASVSEGEQYFDAVVAQERDLRRLVASARRSARANATAAPRALFLSRTAAGTPPLDADDVERAVEDDLGVLSAEARLAGFLREYAGKPEEAESLMRAHATAWRRLRGPFDGETVEIELDRADLLLELGRASEAADVLAELLESLGDARAGMVRPALRHLAARRAADAAEALGDLEEAISLHRAAQKMHDADARIGVFQRDLLALSGCTRLAGLLRARGGAGDKREASEWFERAAEEAHAAVTRHLALRRMQSPVGRISTLRGPVDVETVGVGADPAGGGGGEHLSEDPNGDAPAVSGVAPPAAEAAVAAAAAAAAGVEDLESDGPLMAKMQSAADEIVLRSHLALALAATRCLEQLEGECAAIVSTAADAPADAVLTAAAASLGFALTELRVVVADVGEDEDAWAASPEGACAERVIADAVARLPDPWHVLLRYAAGLGRGGAWPQPPGSRGPLREDHAAPAPPGRAWFAAAERVARRALALQEGARGPCDAALVSTLHELAYYVSMQADAAARSDPDAHAALEADAAALETRASAIALAEFGEDDPRTVVAAAACALHAGDKERADQLARSLKDDRRFFAQEIHRALRAAGIGDGDAEGGGGGRGGGSSSSSPKAEEA